MKKLCPVCGSANVEFSFPPEYEYDDCGTRTTQVAHEQQLLQLIGLTILLGNEDLRGEDLRY